jgi:DNA-binding response OmpR family regulator
VPRVVRRESGSGGGPAYDLDHERPKSIGRLRGFQGNFVVFVRSYAYILSLGADGLADVAAEPTRVFSKQELLRDVWGFRSMGRTRTLDSHASRLRRKLDPEAGRFIVKRVGSAPTSFVWAGSRAWTG